MMGTVDDLVTWLREQIAEDQRVALSVSTGPSQPEVWTAKQYRGSIRDWRVDGQVSVVVDGAFGPDAAHIARHDPRDVLAQCGAHGRILARHEPRLADYGPRQGKLICGCSNGEDEFYATEWPCDDIRDLASAYQHRPGYLEEWRPATL